MKKKVAIVMPVHNAGAYLTKTLQAILDQTYSNWELFAIDDGSTDSSVTILKKFTDPRIHFRSDSDESVKLKADDNGVIIASEKINVGPALTRNKALDILRHSKIGSSFEYVAYCDSDDRWEPSHLQIAVETLEREKVDMVYSDCHFVTDNGQSIKTFGVPYYLHFDRANLEKQNFIYISTVVHRASCLIDNKGFDQYCVPQEDYDMWLRISKTHKVLHIPLVTSAYMYKSDGSYYNDVQSAEAKIRVHLKNQIIQEDLHALDIQLKFIQDEKIKLIRTQKYEEAARLRDTERQLLAKIDSLKGPDSVPGWLSIVEGTALAKYAQDKKCLEIGSFKGKSANYIAPVAESLICIDPFRADDGGQTQYVDYTTLQEFLKNTSKFKNITPVIGKSEDVYQQFQTDQFEMMFIDGMHDYDSVKSDIEKYWPKLKVGGYMCFHDYQKDWTGVIKAVDGFFGKPDALYDSVAVVQKKDTKLELNIDPDKESETLTKLMNDKFLLMTKLGLTNEDIDKLNFYEFNEYVEKLKGTITTAPYDWSKDVDNLDKNKDGARTIKKIVVISPWSHKLPTGNENPKNFPYWEELVADLKAAGCYIKQIGVTGEKLIGADEIIFNASNDRLKEVLFDCDTFISVDSFFPHFAHYHKKHGIVIFSQSDPILFGYPENLNILKSRDYLRKEQFWLWTQAEYNKEAFISSKEVLSNVLKVLQLQ